MYGESRASDENSNTRTLPFNTTWPYNIESDRSKGLTVVTLYVQLFFFPEPASAATEKLYRNGRVQKYRLYTDCITTTVTRTAEVQLD